MWRTCTVVRPIRRPACEVNATPLKMVLPPMSPRMEQFRHLVGFGVDARQVRAFVQITINAGQSQILQVISAAMNARNDMLDVQGSQRGIFLAQLTILATMASALPHA